MLDWDLGSDCHYDLAIIGGGINGCALARDAARAGLAVIVLERRDFGAGVTSRSTRLIHGGLRYLERLHLSLVWASLRDRAALLREFPGQVQPLPFLLPVYRGDSRPAWYVGAGLAMYRALGAAGRLPPPRRLRRAECGRLVPGLDSEGLRACFEYYDCQAVYPERLALEMALQAQEAGAEIRNHARVTRFLRSGSRVVGLGFEGLDGDGEVRCKLAVNAAGAWVDDVLALVRRDSIPPLLTLINGTHVIIPQLRGISGHAVYREARADGRPFFIVPWRGLHMIGTTEIPSDRGPDGAFPGEREVRYLLREAGTLLPEAGITAASALYAYCGSRPVLRTDERNLNKASRGDAIVDHESRDGIGGLLTMAGGKLTTAPSFARRTLGRAFAALGRSRRDPRAAGSEGLAPGPAEQMGTGRMATVYGRRADDVRSFLRSSPELAKPLAPGCETSRGEVVHAVRQERARTLGDILLRRTGTAFAPNWDSAWATAAAEVAAGPLGWDDASAAAAIADFEAELGRTLVRV